MENGKWKMENGKWKMENENKKQKIKIHCFNHYEIKVIIIIIAIFCVGWQKKTRLESLL
jgi:hypothetical protein